MTILIVEHGYKKYIVLSRVTYELLKISTNSFSLFPACFHIFGCGFFDFRYLSHKIPALLASKRSNGSILFLNLFFYAEVRLRTSNSLEAMLGHDIIIDRSEAFCETWQIVSSVIIKKNPRWTGDFSMVAFYSLFFCSSFEDKSSISYFSENQIFLTCIVSLQTLSHSSQLASTSSAREIRSWILV